MQTCLVSGILRDSEGNILADTPVIISPRPEIWASWDGMILPGVVHAESDAVGRIEVSLVSGRYHIQWGGHERSYSSPLSVPDEPTADFADLLVAPPLPIRGSAGASAYDTWLAAGNSGSEQDFLDDLKGDPGPPGSVDFGQISLGTGSPGSGVIYDNDTLFIPRGDPGSPGADGDSAYDIWLAAGNSGSEQDFLTAIKGSPGDPGAPGSPGGDGDSAYDIWLAAGNAGSEQDFLDDLKGDPGADVEIVVIPFSDPWPPSPEEPNTIYLRGAE